MARFVKQITETIRYLSDRSGRENYTKLFPEGVKLPDALRGWLDRKDRKWLRKLYEGYEKLKANEVWAELKEQEPEIFQKLLRLFFPEPIKLRRVYEVLMEWNPDLEPVDLIMLGRSVIEDKDEMLRYDEFYEDYMKLRSGQFIPEDELEQILNKLISGGVVENGWKIEQDGTVLYKVKPLPYFHYMSILLHAYIVFILREMFNEEERLEKKRKDAVLFGLFLDALLGYPLPNKKEIKRKLRRKK
ncbi:MAG: hypothetical protein JHC25_04050 [Thermodesulfobacterium sp.]|jgi:hypothetical protein|nr:hypothetical protein [Thermodesulfobacterium sp.]